MSGHSDGWWETAQKVIDAETDDFAELVRVSGLDPRKDLRYRNLSGLSFAGCDLRNFDFTGARLHSCNFNDTLIEGARLDQAEIDYAGSTSPEMSDVVGPDGSRIFAPDGARVVVPSRPAQRTNLRAALDWQQYLKSWHRRRHLPSDAHLPVGAVFQDAPFAPEMVVMPAGKFLMGSPESEEKRWFSEGPRHEQVISRPFAMGRYVVTMREYGVFANQMGTHLPYREVEDTTLPVVNLAWEDAKAYVDWLNSTIGCDFYRLPTEVEWEYSCRAGTATRYFWGDDPRLMDEYAWFADNADRTIHPVGEKKPNPFGLYDMYGNNFEWCEDIYYVGYPPERVVTADKNEHVVRSGPITYDASELRSAHRFGFDGKRYDIGFRVARSLGR